MGYIKDPIAVPYLTRVEPTDKGLDGWVINALEQIGNGPAIDALLSHVQSPSEDTRMSVLRALNSVEMHTADPALRQRIREARQEQPKPTP